ncbi:MAG TPA: AMP-binding protein, partial [Acidimicrobiia bacterium]|nr:AMP-binding protein [Acidimicrobiia bacterium]
ETYRTYAQLAGRVRRLAHGLRFLGVEHGDRVGWLGTNHPAFLEVLFAAARIGAVIAPVNHRLDAAVINEVLLELSPTVVVVEQSAAGIPLPSGVGSRVVVGSAGAMDVDYELLVAHSPDAPVDIVTQLEDVCMLPHTSGTTGRPKGVMLTHGNVTWNVVNLLSVVDFRDDDVTIAIAPFFRTGGTGVNVLPVLFVGGRVVVSESDDADEILRLMQDQRVTIGFGNPDLLESMTRSPRWPDADLSSIRCFITGGAPVPKRLIRTYLERGLTFLQGYGLSEAAPFVLLLDAPSALNKMGSAGEPPLFVDVRVVQPDGAECATDETGELLVRGPNVMAGYWRRPDATREAVDEDGWLRTGDAARIDHEGYVWIVDRVADAYEASGHVVYPGNVERVLADHPAVSDVGVAAHDGTATAFVVLAKGEHVGAQELLESCRARLPAHAVPSSVVFVNHLPRSSVGKLLRQELLLR